MALNWEWQLQLIAKKVRNRQKGETWRIQYRWVFLIPFTSPPLEMDLTVVKMYIAEKKAINVIEFLS